MKLSRAERAAMFEGTFKPLQRPAGKPCPCAVGDAIPLSPRFWIEVKKIVRNASGESYVVRYDVFDHRLKPRLLKRTPAITRSEYARTRRGFDEHGYPVHQPSTPETDVATAEESAYGGDPGASVEDAGDGVEREWLDRFARDWEESREALFSISAARREHHALEARLVRAREDAKARGIDISSPERVIERQLVKIEKRVYEGKEAA